jgi:hypothetical protein
VTGSSITVFPLVFVIHTPPYPSALVVMVVDSQVYHMLDRDTSIVAQPGVQSRVFGGAHFLSSVVLQYRLCCWTQLGARGNRRRLRGPEKENTVLTAITHCPTESDDKSVSNAYTPPRWSKFCTLHFCVTYNVQVLAVLGCPDISCNVLVRTLIQVNNLASSTLFVRPSAPSRTSKTLAMST